MKKSKLTLNYFWRGVCLKKETLNWCLKSKAFHYLNHHWNRSRTWKTRAKQIVVLLMVYLNFFNVLWLHIFYTPLINIETILTFHFHLDLLNLQNFSRFSICASVLLIISSQVPGIFHFPMHAVCVCVWNFPTITKFHNTFEPWGGRERNSRKCFDNPQVIVRFGADCQFIDLSIFYVPLRLRIDSHLSLLVKDSRYCHYLWFSIYSFLFLCATFSFLFVVIVVAFPLYGAGLEVRRAEHTQLARRKVCPLQFLLCDFIYFDFPPEKVCP